MRGQKFELIVRKFDLADVLLFLLKKEVPQGKLYTPAAQQNSPGVLQMALCSVSLISVIVIFYQLALDSPSAYFSPH